MPRVHVYDAPGGDSILLDLVDESNGYLQPTFNRDEDERFTDFFNIRNIPCRDDDLLLNSFPKSGTHWSYEMVSLIRKKTPKVTGKSKIVEMIECIPTSGVNELPSPRMLNSHLRIKYLPQDAFKRKTKMLLVLRNPKDVVVSLYHHTRGLIGYGYAGKFENFVQAFIRGEVEYGSYPEYLLEWQQFIRDNPDYPILVVYYEDMKKDLLKELKRFREFLDIDISDELLQEIGNSLVFNKMKSGKESAMTQDDKDFLDAFTRPEFSFLRKGLIGDWKNTFTVAQNEVFDAWWRKQTKGLDMFKFQYS